MEGNKNRFIQIKVARGLQPWVALTQHHPPAKKPFFHLKQSKITQHCECTQEYWQHFSIDYKISASRSLWWGIHIHMITERWVIFWILISVFYLIVPASTWRMKISYSSLVENGVVSVRGEASRRFHDLPPRILVHAICPFLTIALYRGEKQHGSSS